MYNLYETIKSLCDEKGIKPGKMCVEANISKGLISDLKAGRKKTVRVETAQKIADYFGVTVDRVLGAPAENAQKEAAAPKGDGMSTKDAERPYVDMSTARIWSRHPVAILAAQYRVPTATLQQIIGCDFNAAGNIALGLEVPTDEQLRRVAAAFCVPYGDLTRGWVPLSANRGLSFDNIPRSSDRSPSPEGQ